MPTSGFTRRQFLARAGATTGAAVIAPIVGRAGTAFGQSAADPATAGRHRLVVVFLEGGNDGLNYVIPRGDVAGSPRLSVYRKVRPTLAYRPHESLPLDLAGDADHQLGFNRRLSTLHRFYKEGRVAIVQGVDYPKHNYSHFRSIDIWHSGEPERAGSSGWLGRHIDRAGIGDGELRGVALGSKIPLMLTGQRQAGAAMTSIASMRFSDGSSGVALSRHAALARFGAPRPADPLRNHAGRMGAQTVSIVDGLRKTNAPPATGSPIGDALLSARVLLEQNLGVECVYVTQGGYDTHTNQVRAQEGLLAALDAGLEMFWLGTSRGGAVGSIGALNPAIASRTLVVIVSEFGRRIGEAGGASVAGTDHGAAAPVILLGPPAAGDARAALVAGIHGDHPSMGTVAAPADNLEMTTDLRTVYQSVLESWFEDPDPSYRKLGALPGLFVRNSNAAPGGKTAAKVGGVNTAVTGAAATSTTGHAGTTAPDVAPNGEMSLRDIGDGASGFHPASALAGAALNALVLLLLVRSGQLRNLGRRVQQLLTAETPAGE